MLSNSDFMNKIEAKGLYWFDASLEMKVSVVKYYFGKEYIVTSFVDTKWSNKNGIQKMCIENGSSFRLLDV